jgi:hypothetical protein
LRTVPEVFSLPACFKHPPLGNCVQGHTERVRSSCVDGIMNQDWGLLEIR